MQRLPRRLAALFILGSFALAACAGSSGDAATVNDQAITDVQLDAISGVFGAVAGVQQVPCGSIEGDSDTAEAACNRFSLGALIQFTLSEDYAAANDLTVSEDDVRIAAEQFEANFGVELLAEQLDLHGSSREAFIDLVRSSLLQDAVAKALAAVELGEDGLRERYDAALAEFTIVDVDHILVETRAEADAVYDIVTKEGATRKDFLSLAQKESIDPSAEQNRGALGPAAASGYVPEFAAAALALEAGEISQPVQTEFGWHVIHLVEKQVTPFEQIRDQLLDQEAPQVFVGWIRDQDEEGVIEVNPSFGRFDAEALTVVRISSTDPSATNPPASVEVPAQG